MPIDVQISLPIILALVLSIINFYSEDIEKLFAKKKHRFVTFAAGFSIAYLFLSLLPESIKSEAALQQWLFIFMLVGFALFRLAEVIVYRHSKGSKRRKELREEHSIAFFIYHALIGVSIVYFLGQSLRQGILFFVPVTFHVMATSAALSELHGSVRRNVLTRILLSIAPLLGVILAVVYPFSLPVFGALVGTVLGALFFVVIKELLPARIKEGPQFFLMGIFTFIIILLILQVIL